MGGKQPFVCFTATTAPGGRADISQPEILCQHRASTNRRAMDSPSIPFGVAVFEFRIHMLPLTNLGALSIHLKQLFHRVEARRPEN